MIPDLASVMRRRYWLESVIRLAAAALFAIWLSLFVGQIVAVASGNGPPRMSTGQFLNVAYLLGSLARTTPLLIGALFLAALNQRLARWIVPFPKSGCPRCGYRLIALREPRCPECGMPIPRELLEPEA
jgi:hypothetical protein